MKDRQAVPIYDIKILFGMLVSQYSQLSLSNKVISDGFLNINVSPRQTGISIHLLLQVIVFLFPIGYLHRFRTARQRKPAMKSGNVPRIGGTAEQALPQMVFGLGHIGRAVPLRSVS